MTKKVTTKDLVVKDADFVAGNYAVKSGTYDCLDIWTNNYTLATQQLVNRDLVLTLTNGNTITLLDYVTAQGTSSSSYKYVKDANFAVTKGEVKVLGEDVAITNKHLIDEFYANGGTTVTGTVTNDTINVSGYVAKDGKTGLTVNALAGNDTITGTAYNDKINATAGNNVITEVTGDNVIVTGAGNDTVTLGTGNDTVTLGTGANVINIDAAEIMGNDVINLTKTEGLIVNVTNDLAGQIQSIEKVGSDVKVTLLNQKWDYTEVNTNHAGTLYDAEGNVVAAKNYYTLVSAGEAGLNSGAAYTGSVEAGFEYAAAVTNLYKASVNTASESTIGTLGYVNGAEGVITTVPAATSAFTLAETEVTVNTAAAYTKAGGVYTKQTEAVALYKDANHTVVEDRKISELNAATDHLYDANGNEIEAANWEDYARYTLVETDKSGATVTEIGAAQLYAKDANDNYTAIDTPSIRYAIAGGTAVYTGTVTDLAGAKLYTKSGDDFTLAQTPEARYTVTPTTYGNNAVETVSAMKADNNKYYTLAGGVYTSIDKSTLATYNTRAKGLAETTSTITFKNLGNTDVTGAAIAVNFDNNADITDLRTTHAFVAENLGDTNKLYSFTGTYLKDQVTADATEKALNINAGDGANEINTVAATGKNTVNGGKDNDSLTGGSGDETIKLGAGTNTVNYDLSTLTTMGNNVINLTKNEQLVLNIKEGVAGQIVYNYAGNDLQIKAKVASGKEYSYEFEKVVTADSNEVKTYHQEATTFGDAVAVSYKRVVDDGTNPAKVYEYTKEGSKFYWVQTGTQATSGAETTKYYRLDAKNTVMDASSLIGEFKPDKARADLGKDTYLKTVTDKSYTGGGWNTTHSTVTEAVSVKGTDSATYTLVTTYSGFDAQKVTQPVPSTTDFENPTDPVVKTVKTVYQFDKSAGSGFDVDANWKNPVVTITDHVTAGTVYNEYKVNIADAEDVIAVAGKQGVAVGILDAYNIANDVTAKTLTGEYGDGGVLTIKNAKSQDLSTLITLNKGTDLATQVNLSELHNVVQLSNQSTSFTGTYVIDEVTVAAGTTKNLSINTGAGNDIITGGQGDDTLNPGAGENTVNYDLNGAKFGNDKITVTKDSTVNLAITNITNANQIKYSKINNDLKVTAYGMTETSTYYEYNKTVSTAVATTKAGYKYHTAFTGPTTIAYTKTEVDENYTKVGGDGANKDKYLKVSRLYEYTKVGDNYEWKLAEEQPDDSYENDPVDGECTYYRKVDAAAPVEYVWNDPDDMCVNKVTKTVTEYKWNDDADEFQATGVVETTIVDAAGVDGDTYKLIETDNAGTFNYRKVVKDNATADEAGVDSVAGTTVYVKQDKTLKATGDAADEANWDVTHTATEFDNEAAATTYLTKTYQKVGDGEFAVTATSTVAPDAYDAHRASTNTIDAAAVSTDALGTITITNGSTIDATIQVNGASIFTKDFAIESATGGVLTGTTGVDNFVVTGGSSATFNTLAGADVIDTDAKKNIFNHTAGTDNITSTGNDDTIALSAGNELTVASKVSKAGSIYSFDVDGDDTVDVSYTNAAVEKLTIDNKGTKHNVEVITANVDEDAAAKQTNNTVGLVAGDAAVSYIDGKGNDLVFGNNQANKYYYANGGTDIYKGGTGNDIYNVEVSTWSNAKNRLVIADASGTDVLNLSTITKDKLAFYFDVDKNGNNFETVTNGSKDLAICDKSVVKDLGESHVLVKNYNGTGAIDKVTVSGGSETGINMATTIGAITTAVQGWLNNHNFDSTIDVMENGNKYDQASLLACFNNAAITENPAV